MNGYHLQNKPIQTLFSERARGESEKQTETGPIPESWEVVELNQIADLKNGYAFKSKDYVSESNTLNIRMSNIRPGAYFDLEYNPRFLPDEYTETYSSFLLNDGDLIIAMTDMANNPKILGVPTIVRNPSGKKLLLNQRVGKLIPAKNATANFDFLRYYLSSKSAQQYLISRAKKGVQVNIGKKDILSIVVPYPPLYEQLRIAAVLSLVLRAIDQQKRLIGLTTELRKALMHKLFTEGTHDEAQKQIDIGPVPESWEVVEIGDIFKFTSGKTKPKDTKPTATDGRKIPVYGGNGVLGYSSQHLLQESTLILGRVGEYCGCAHLTLPVSWVTDNALYVKEEKTKVNQAYIRTHFEYLNLNKYSNKMGQPLITQGIINRVKFGLPKPEEQDELATVFEVLDSRLRQIKGKQASLQDLLRTLLHQLMTAEIRVNNIDLEELGLDSEK